MHNGTLMQFAFKLPTVVNMKSNIDIWDRKLSLSFGELLCLNKAKATNRSGELLVDDSRGKWG